MKERKKLIYVHEPPEGLFYLPGFLTSEQEEQILTDVSAQPFEPYDHHGYKANREVVYFGLQGGYNGVGAADKAENMPEWLVPLRDRFASLVGLTGDELAMALVARYNIGAGIGWHRDRPQFGTVLGISLASDAEMRFRRYVDDKEEMFKITLERGSAYIMSGPARAVWQHGMNPVKQLRFSITLRTLREKNGVTTDPRQTPEQLAQQLIAGGIRYAELGSKPQPPGQLKLALATGNCRTVRSS